jgi:hypothetical protein
MNWTAKSLYELGGKLCTNSTRSSGAPVLSKASTLSLVVVVKFQVDALLLTSRVALRGDVAISLFWLMRSSRIRERLGRQHLGNLLRGCLNHFVFGAEHFQVPSLLDVIGLIADRIGGKCRQDLGSLLKRLRKEALACFLADPQSEYGLRSAGHQFDTEVP